MTATAVRFHGLSDIGPVRDANQDLIRASEPPDAHVAETHGSLYAIADGMGGYAKGEVASQVALETFFGAFYDQPAGDPAQRLRRAMEQANLAVNQAAFRLHANPMGTTLTVANICGDQLHLIHVGDTRAYLIRDGLAQCLTNDHSMVGELVRMRAIGPERVRTHPQRSVLNRCLGLSLFVKPDVRQVTLRRGDVVLLCSDGLWAWVEDDELARLGAQPLPAEQVCQGLVNLALERGTDDNVSVLVTQVDAVAATQGARALAPAGWRRVIAFLGHLF